MRRVSDRWLQERHQLHDAFIDAFGVPDVFWMGHLGTPLDRWTDAQVRDAWAQSRPRADAQHNVYVHVPFCKSICSFCNYDRLRPSSPAYLNRWRKRVLRSLEIIAPGLRDYTFHTIYVGGGTPSVLPAEAVQEVMGAINQLLQFHPQASRYFEMDPAVINPGRMRAWQDQGFHNTSFGIQTLDEDINEAHNRGRQGRRLVQRRFHELREHGMRRISCDFLLGLAETKPEVIAAEIEEVLADHRPENIDIYQLTPTPEYLERHFDGDSKAFWRHARGFTPLVRETMPKLAAKYGYDIVGDESGHRTSLILREGDHPSTTGWGRLTRWIPDDIWNRFARTPRAGQPREQDRYSYQQTVSEQGGPLSTLGLGPSARSRLFGNGRFEYRDPDDDPDAEGPAWWIRQGGDMATEVCTYSLLSLRDADTLDRRVFRQIFQDDLQHWLPEGLAALSQLGRAEITPDQVTLQSADSKQRARDLMWLVPTERLEFKLAERRSLSLTASGLQEHLGDITPGTALAGAMTLHRVRSGHLDLQHAGHTISLRVAPALEQGKPTRLVIEAPLPEDSSLKRDLRASIAVLRKRLTPTGAPKRVGTGAFIRPGRPTSM